LAKKLINLELDLGDASLCIGYDSLYVDKSRYQHSFLSLLPEENDMATPEKHSLTDATPLVRRLFASSSRVYSSPALHFQYSLAVHAMVYLEASFPAPKKVDKRWISDRYPK
jgi:hypothetical protein